MARRLPPLNALRAFEAAGRRKSFTGAAKELNVSHAAISRHVRGLEARLGVQLFRNLPRGVALTAAGVDYLSDASRALDLIEAATERVSGNARRRVSVSVEPTFALKWLAPRLGDFHASHPNIEIVVDATASIADLRGGECDVAIRWTRDEIDEPGAALLSNHPVHPVSSPGYAAGLAPPVPPERLMALALLHEDYGALWRRWFDEAGMKGVPLPESAGRIGSLMAIEAALAGQGVALVSEELSAGDVASGRLVRLSDFGVDFGGYHVITPPGSRAGGASALFRDWLLDATAALRPETAADGGLSRPRGV